MGSNVVWRSYASNNANISFDYPAEWTISDQTITAAIATASDVRLTYTSLWICPPALELEVTKIGANNCITFFTKTRLLQPPANFIDESSIFADLKNSIQDANATDTRIFTRKPQSGYSELIGVYKKDDDMIGVNQPVCENAQNSKCVSIFKHVLQSIEFLQ